MGMDLQIMQLDISVIDISINSPSCIINEMQRFICAKENDSFKL